MNLQDLAAATLLFVSGILGVEPIAKDAGSWQVVHPWQEIASTDGTNSKYMSFEAQSSELLRHCRENPESSIVFPAIIHGSHVISVGQNTVLQFGDPNFQTMRSFYGQPVLSCKSIPAGDVLSWKAYSYTKYFARISYFPKLVNHTPLYNVFAETFHIIGAGAGLLMAIFTFTIFAGKVSRPTTLSVCASSFFSSFYLGGCVAGFMGIPWSMLTVHKLADIGVWFSISMLVNALRHEGLVSKKVTLSYIGTVLFAIVIIIFGNSGDLVQFGTTLPFMLTLFVLSVPLFSVGKTLMRNGRSRSTWLQFLSLGSFVLAVFNEMFAVTGLIHSSPMLPFGFMGGVMFLALSVNERVNETYFERDYLRENLETEVERKTTELKSAMNELKTTQAELIQSAKLASLGTLSAGIAHEINNSLNYVNGALKPLESMIAKSVSGPEQEKMNKLLGVMKDGLNLTLEIVKSLRNYTGLNQAKHNDVNISQVVTSSLTILRNRIRGRINVQCDIPSDMTVLGSVVGLNQVFMNLISNALDAMSDGGTLTIHGERENDLVRISVRDTGKGIPKEAIDRIFEPFFTTKEVGSGTGLGLHIVRQEIQRHKGELKVESEPGAGTTFYMSIPCKAFSENQAA
ncbi:MAG TPA: HAMP domain-containing sensor histidine kinase [Bdellovibrionales bacterium]|nr:HAMP domain-containing sensor histidine kinase [Bdellovibrionales bacterium]